MSKRRRSEEWSPGAAGPVLRLVDLDPGTATWRDFAACLGTDPEAFFPTKGGATGPAKRLCRSCPVRLQCLEDALEWEASEDYIGEPHGIRGGLSAIQRKAIMRERAA